MNNEKYIRQIALPQVGHNGQQKLNLAKVLVVGAGGLGNAVLPYLASSGIGTIGVIDGDTVAMSNLHRQVLFSETDIGKSKAVIVYNKLSVQFPKITFIAYNEFLSGENALPLFADYNIIVDATDNIKIRYLINDACKVAEKPFVHAAVYRFQFQVATFNVKGSGTYSCLYPKPPITAQNCAEAGVMPSTVAMAGLYQTNEILKYILNIGELLINCILLVDVLTNNQHKFRYQKKDQDVLTEFCFKEKHIEKEINTITFRKALKLGGIFLDVRQGDEKPLLSFENYVRIPVQELQENLSEIPREKHLYVFCQTGKRSRIAFHLLHRNQFDNVYRLKENASEIKELTTNVL